MTLTQPQVLAGHSRMPAKEHMPTIRPEELPAFMKAVSLASIDLTTRLVIKWQLLTLVRPAEAG